MRADDRRGTIRRRFVILMRQEARWRKQVGEERAAGRSGDFAAATCSAIGWAIEELSKIYPGRADMAREDYRRFGERRALERGARDLG
jgi:hypothetical protein